MHRMANGNNIRYAVFSYSNIKGYLCIIFFRI